MVTSKEAIDMAVKFLEKAEVLLAKGNSAEMFEAHLKLARMYFEIAQEAHWWEVDTRLPRPVE